VTIIATCIGLASWSVGALLQVQVLSQPDHPTAQYTRLSHFQGTIHYTTPMQELGTILAVVGFFGGIIIFLGAGVMHAVQLFDDQQRTKTQPQNSEPSAPAKAD
jgi:hypothetical protein